MDTSIQRIRSPQIVIAEFADSLYSAYTNLANLAPDGIVKNPKVYVGRPVHAAKPIEFEKGVAYPAYILDVGFHYSIQTDRTRLIIQFKAPPRDAASPFIHMGYTLYAVLAYDAYRSRALRTYSRGLITALKGIRDPINLALLSSLHTPELAEIAQELIDDYEDIGTLDQG
jgi:hypothetical protein